MTRSELSELIYHGENSGVEFKRDKVRPENLAKDIVALANFRGGYILLGWKMMEQLVDLSENLLR